MIKNILGALLLGLLLTACGKTGEETTNPTVQDSTAADAEARRRAEEERLAREKAEAERVAREEAEKIEQARLAAESERAALTGELRRITDALISYNGKLDGLNEYKLSLENLLAKFKLLGDQTFITNTNTQLGKVNGLIATRTPQKGTPKQVALEKVKRIIEASKNGQATLQELRELTDTIKPYKAETEFSGIEGEIKAAENDMLAQGRRRIEEYLNQIADISDFNAAKKGFLQGKAENVRAKEVLRLENLIALTDEKAGDRLINVRTNLFDMFIRMLMIEKSSLKLLSLPKPNKGFMTRAKEAISVLNDTVNSIIPKNHFDTDITKVVKDHFRQQLNDILRDTNYFETAELKNIDKNTKDTNTRSFLGW